MESKFEFVNFSPDADTLTLAREVFDHVRDRAPVVATLIARLEKSDQYYKASIEVYSKRCPVYSVAASKDPLIALSTLEKKVIDKMKKNQETRFFTRTPYTDNGGLSA